MLLMRLSKLKRTGNDQGIAVTTEYVLLLGVSLLIFTAVFIGFNSFSNTASADARSETAYGIAAHVSECIADASRSDGAVTKRIDLQERICGSPYLVYPSGDGRSICVLVNSVEYEAPVIAPTSLKFQGFMMSVPAGHRIDYEPTFGTVALS